MARLGVDLSFLDNVDAAFQTSALNADLPAQLPTLQTERFEMPSGVHGAQFLQAQKDKVEEKNKQDNTLALTASAGPASLPNPYGPSKFTHNANPNIRVNHGTTTMAFLFDAGVLVAVDSRASMGSYIGSATVKKVIPISKFLLGTMAGGAADCSFWERNLAYQCRVHELREGRRITVAAASKMLASTVYQYRGMGLSMGTMVAGWDEVGGPALYYVDNDGTRLKGDMFSVGSGATYAYGVLDNEYRRDLTIEEAVDLGKRSIWHATHRDAYSGGTINVFVITQDGWTQHFKGDMNDLYYNSLKAKYDAPATSGNADGAGEQKMED